MTEFSGEAEAEAERFGSEAFWALRDDLVAPPAAPVVAGPSG
jgi:hypothetical protein